MMGKLDNKSAIITGAAAGMGKGVARTFVRYGAEIALIDFSEAVFDTAKELQKEGYNALGYQVDVRDAAGLKNTYAEIAERFGKIDILVNVAGVGDLKLFWEADDEFRDRIFDVNFKGTWNSCRAAVPYMMNAGYGKIVNFGSVTGVLAVDPGMTAYASSKGAIMGFTKALAQDLASHNITVNAILPGMVDTPMLQKSCTEACPEDPQSIKNNIASGIPLKRLGTPEEAGEVAAFLSSEESSYVTGTHIVFDGGSTLPETPATGWSPNT